MGRADCAGSGWSLTSPVRARNPAFRHRHPLLMVHHPHLAPSRTPGHPPSWSRHRVGPAIRADPPPGSGGAEPAVVGVPQGDPSVRNRAGPERASPRAGAEPGAAAGGGRVPRWPLGDRGSVTVEAAVGIGAVVAVLVLCVQVVMAVVGQVRCVDAAREAARLVARGDQARAAGVVAAIAPEGARLVVRVEGDAAVVEVSAVGLFVPVRASAFAMVEPGAGDG
ncbi:TadE family type IV pilus minor pilin [Actinosynnema sp. NPDC020468]|uniref:TadE family type IV pilus minor pilin n=1 Tax=Actinosynnema sp. NPDC020468 TaxID=3154488 RepID=UPI003405C04A